ncbi:protein translocase subunit SecA [Clostridia bacterium]|nr:protein translocase subunit SecA [Clostridia bacterium]GHU34859.1 protein translocase subunit SecA [Clostridia bacterium]
MGIFRKIFGSYSDHQLKKIVPVANETDALREKYKALPDDAFGGMTDAFKKRFNDGEELGDLLPEAFAAVREAFDRVLHKPHFRVQIIGGIVLHQGRIAEMKTGEGKTQTAVLAAFLNALTGEGVHIVTVNDYLARVGAESMGKVLGFLGMSVGLIVHGLSNAERRAAYAADITYGTNNEMGFDYLRDNMVIRKEEMVQRGHAFAIVDEVDSILIDEARTPLIISGQGDKSTDLYEKTDKFTRGLKMFKIKELNDKESHEDIDADYIVDEKAKTAVLTQSGIKKAETYFGVENLSDPENTDIHHHVNISIRARGVMQNEIDYVVKDNQVIIVDSFTGRMMHGRRYSDGLHQAIEAKESVKIEHESKTLATVTFQNYFRLYKKLSGMTGTALTEENEFREIYRLDVVEIPTDRPMIRKDQNDIVYPKMAGKYQAIIDQIKECHAKGQPVLVGTVSVEKSEHLSGMLKREGIKHNVLNAKYHEKEAEIVAQAGQFGAVTISTNMAGRGTDIMLGGNAEHLAKNELAKLGYPEEDILNAVSFAHTEDEQIIANRKAYANLVQKFSEEIKPQADKVREAGGLFVLGTERHESRRIDNQLRGRSGRQGDPGESRFYLSLEDDLMRLFGSDRMMALAERLGEDTPIDAKLLSNSIEGAQKRLEGNHFERRKNVLRYDDVMNQQRKLIYAQRQEVLNGNDIHGKILGMITEVIDASVGEYCAGEETSEWNLEGLRDRFKEYQLTNDKDFIYEDEAALANVTEESIRDLLNERAKAVYATKEQLFGDKLPEVERVVLLRNVDTNWMEHIDQMTDLQNSIGLRAYAQRDPIIDFRVESADMFEAVITTIRDNTVRHIMNVIPRPSGEELKRRQIARQQVESVGGGEKPVRRPMVIKREKPGRNDPCPCGSGKKYKKCCGVSDSEQ